MKKICMLFVFVVLVFAIALLAIGCSSNEPATEKEVEPSENVEAETPVDQVEDSKPKGVENTVTLRVASEVPDLPDERYEALAMRNFINFLEQYGNFKIEYYPGAALGDQLAVYEQVARGQCDVTGVATGNVAGIDYPNLMILDLPYLFTDPGIAAKVLNPSGRLVSALRDDMIKKNGVRILCIVPDGYRHLTNNAKEIKTPEDLKGLKIRTMNAPAQIAAWEAAGAQVTPMSFSELYSALQTGVVDGQENPLPVILGNSLQEVQKYVTLSRHLMATTMLVMNENTYQGMSKAQQEQLNRATELYYYSIIANATADTNSQIELIQKEGMMQLYNPNEAEVELFREKMQPAARKIIEKEIEDTQFIDMLFEEIEKYKIN